MTVRDLAGAAMQTAEMEVRLTVGAGDPDNGGAVLLGGAERYGVAVTWVVLQGTEGGQQVNLPVWFLALTRDSPIVGSPALSYCQPVGSPAPDDAEVRAQARAGVTAIRALYRQQLAATQS
jgi:hypothetical protein